MKARFKFLLVSMAITVAVLFSVGEVIAFNDNCNFEIGELPISVPAGPYTVTLDTVMPADPECNPDEGTCLYNWNYKIHVTGDEEDLTGLNFFAMLIPECCNEPYIEINSSNPELASFAAGVGEDVLNFGKYIENATVIKGTPNSTVIWEITTNTNTITKTTGIVKYGKKTTAASIEMPGPGCADACVEELPPVRVEPVTQCYQFTAENLDDGCELIYSRWRIDYNPLKKCEAVDVWAEYGTTPFTDCSYIDIDANHLDGIDLDTTKLKYTPEGSQIEVEKELTYILGVDECDVGWIQTINEGECNARCYKIAGRLYCR